MHRGWGEEGWAQNVVLRGRQRCVSVHQVPKKSLYQRDVWQYPQCNLCVLVGWMGSVSFGLYGQGSIQVLLSLPFAF
jgi:hypothetical protein